MADIEVFGGGIFGLSVAWALTKRGARVRVIEKARIGAGASGGLVGALAPHTPDNWNAKKQFQFESLVMAADWWAGVAATGGLSPGYARTGRLAMLPDARAADLARARAAEAAAHWGDRFDWQVIDTAPGWQVPAEHGFVFETLSARMSPRAAASALAAALKASGVEILEGTTEGRGADVTVLATGWQGLADLSRDFGPGFGTGVKGQGALLAHNARDLPQLFVEAIHVVPHADGTTAIGSTSENDWTDAAATDAQLDTLIARTRALVPPLADAPVLEKWAGIRPRGRRRAPIIGAHPGRANTYIANGGFKIGFGVAPKVGEVMADLILTGSADIPDTFTVEANLRR
jgi:glycine oxidase